MKTAIPSAPGIERHWHLIDAEEAVLGRVAGARLPSILMGVIKPSYTPYIDTGDHVVVVNAEKVRLTAAKKNRSFIALGLLIRRTDGD